MCGGAEAVRLHCSPAFVPNAPDGSGPAVRDLCCFQLCWSPECDAKAASGV